MAVIAREHVEGLKPWVEERVKLAQLLVKCVCERLNGQKGTSVPNLLQAINDAKYVAARPAKALLSLFLVKTKWGKKATIAEVRKNINTLRTVTAKSLKVNIAGATQLQSQITWIENRIGEVLEAKASELWTLEQSFVGVSGGAVSSDAKALVDWIFDYKWWTEERTGEKDVSPKWTAGALAEKLDVKTCPYCNRQYTFSVKRQNGGVIRPDFDHFFEKSEHPLLALSFYNLVPSCTTCNSRLKHRTPFSIDKYVHPYVEGFEDDCVFQLGDSVNGADPLALIEQPETVPLSMRYSDRPDLGAKKGRMERNLEVFEIETLYKGHRDVVAELVLKHRTYSNDYVEGLRREFPGARMTDDVVSLILWGNYTELADLGKRPLAKLTRDIVRDLKKRT